MAHQIFLLTQVATSSEWKSLSSENQHPTLLAKDDAVQYLPNASDSKMKVFKISQTESENFTMLCVHLLKHMHELLHSLNMLSCTRNSFSGAAVN